MDIHVPDTSKCANGDARMKKLSTTESVHSKTRFSETGDDEGDDR